MIEQTYNELDPTYQVLLRHSLGNIAMLELVSRICNTHQEAIFSVPRFKKTEKGLIAFDDAEIGKEYISRMNQYQIWLEFQGFITNLITEQQHVSRGEQEHV